MLKIIIVSESDNSGYRKMFITINFTVKSLSDGSEKPAAESWNKCGLKPHVG